MQDEIENSTPAALPPIPKASEHPSMAPPQNSWGSQIKDLFLGKFMATKADEYAEFLAKEEARAAAAQQFQYLNEKVETAKNNALYLANQVAMVKQMDVANSIYQNFKSGANGMLLEPVCNGLTPYALLAQHGDQVIELAKAELEGLEAQLERLKKERKRELKELELI